MTELFGDYLTSRTILRPQTDFIWDSDLARLFSLPFRFVSNDPVALSHPQCADGWPCPTRVWHDPRNAQHLVILDVVLIKVDGRGWRWCWEILHVWKQRLFINLSFAAHGVKASHKATVKFRKLCGDVGYILRYPMLFKSAERFSTPPLCLTSRFKRKTQQDFKVSLRTSLSFSFASKFLSPGERCILEVQKHLPLWPPLMINRIFSDRVEGSNDKT